MMATPNPAKPRCIGGCETLLGNLSNGRIFCAKCGNPPAMESETPQAASYAVDVELKLAEDELFYGNSYHFVDTNGHKVRIDPKDVVMRSTIKPVGLFAGMAVVEDPLMAPNDIKLVNAGSGDFDPADLIRAIRRTSKVKTACIILDHADELGKVWDVLHAAGINGAGGMSAAEGVKLLAARCMPEANDKPEQDLPLEPWGKR